MFDTKKALDHWSEAQKIDIDEENFGKKYGPSESKKADKRGSRITEVLSEVICDGFDPLLFDKYAD